MIFKMLSPMSVGVYLYVESSIVVERNVHSAHNSLSDMGMPGWLPPLIRSIMPA